MEFALVIPLLLLLVLGTIETGRFLAILSSLSSAAKQAARYGAVAGDRDAATAGEQPFYADCQGIRTEARGTALFVGLSDEAIDIRYERGTASITETVAICAAGAISPTFTVSTTSSIRDGDRIIVSLSTTYRPLVPLVPLPDMPMAVTAARTILTEIAGPTNTPRPYPDLGIEKADSLDPVLPGGDLTYVITVTNHTGADGNVIVVTDTLPIEITAVDLSEYEDDNEAEGWDCATVAGSPLRVVCELLPPLAANNSAVIKLLVTAPLTSGITITNTAVVDSVRGDDPDLNFWPNTTTETTLIVGGADLEPFKSASHEPVGGGTVLTYTISVRNNGSEDAEWDNNPYLPNVLTDTLPVGVVWQSTFPGSDWDTCLPPDAQRRIVCRRNGEIEAGVTLAPLIIVVTAPTTAGEIVNQVTVASMMTDDPVPSNNTATVTSTITSLADLALTKTTNPSPPALVNGGDTFSYRLNVSNKISSSATSLATGIVVTDTLPAAVTLNSVSGTSWTCSPTSGLGVTVVCTYANSLLPGEAASELSLFASAPVTGALYVNTAVAAAVQPDPDSSNNTATADVQVVDCNRTIANATASVVTASPAQVQADGTSYADVLVELRDNCSDHALVTNSQSVTLSANQPTGQTINVAGGSGATGTTTTGQISFRVTSILADTTTTYSAVANSVPVVNIADTASVDFYGCVTGSLGISPGTSDHRFVDYSIANNLSYARRLTNLSLSWPQSGSRKITSIEFDLTTTIWSGGSNHNPFTLPNTSPAENFSGTSGDRTLNPAQAKTMRLNFNFNVVGAPPGSNAFVLNTTWDDGSGGRVCSNSLTYVK